jgi:prepilin-type N-terminal cleavage/methylation domain-containing protein
MNSKPPVNRRRPDRPLTSVRRRRGFTLIELLTVIAILAILMAMTLAIISYATKKGADVRTKGGFAAIKAGLKSYYDEYGEYPEPADNGGSGLGGGMTLYQALNDDGNDQIVGAGAESSNGDAGPGRILDLVAEGYVAKEGSKYFVKDGYDHAFNYRLNVHDPDNPDAKNKGSYDLWSFGDDKDRNNEALWIKNW